MATPAKQEPIPLITYAFVSWGGQYNQVNAAGALKKPPLYGCRPTFGTIADDGKYIRGGNFPTPSFAVTQTRLTNTQEIVDEVATCCSLPDEIEHREHFKQYAREPPKRLAVDEAVGTRIYAICNVAGDSVLRSTLRSAIQIFGECSVNADASYLHKLVGYDRLQPI